jgi:peptidylprolyl isomerase
VVYLHRGTGPKVVARQLLVANYMGQIWRGKVFDSSFARKQLSAFPIGIDEVIPAWDKGLVGVPLGSRVLLIVPPVDGYGTKGDSTAGITGKDTIVFVIDLVAAYSKSSLAQSNPVVLHNAEGGVSVVAKGGAQPTIKIAKNTTKPTSVGFYELAAGTGPKITAGVVVLQFLEDTWTGGVYVSTWKLGVPFGDDIGNATDPVIFDDLIGLNVGSRVLFDLPYESTLGGPYALVAEVVAQPHDGAA